MRRGLVPAVMLPLALACDSLGPSDCLDGVTFTVSAGTEPTFDWAPSCRMQALVVHLAEAPNHDFVWSVHTPLGSNGLQPPIRYGEVPPHASSNSPAPALSEGTAYRLSLYASINSPVDNGSTQVPVDSTVFVP
ncbi:MAG TPA: hypothetical protein VHR43_11155 [Gemmatimonadales bacterium]|jgi:hypothetical protein|nr:hypothetical protein [Gemmatimonadales bacterium]